MFIPKTQHYKSVFLILLSYNQKKNKTILPHILVHKVSTFFQNLMVTSCSVFTELHTVEFKIISTNLTKHFNSALHSLFIDIIMQYEKVVFVQHSSIVCYRICLYGLMDHTGNILCLVKIMFGSVLTSFIQQQK